ncbi:50S ribosomal protein L24 [Candidatus Riesia pediculicola]|uniref:Large ribosomal subunit protein uL24 n=1 Tax=Riesia pediculicola (strain USDA) TaxID=515618 RepID=D4G8M3_RIEPU|nr:50S ribosomal protein L24 [Candidatus Riesia pediculicola]ADD79442.1 ribosomal protein L24 [Candidatus Riesia pediculicola USDA]ARC53901.1 50S ribosomal protein L24 [Candidatus Riesia pediculicola]ARC54339.1 50S ribosomal protein L24 [Candidatus Riesia pediculicola]QOJ86532.1 50S ribosomal protein L24 [Candidatus Riesia pediculicola]
MSKIKIRSNDQVMVITGEEKGKIGTVKKIIGKKKIIVSGIKIVKKHKKANNSINYSGGILKEESPIDISNVTIFDRKSKKLNYLKYQDKKEKK